MDNFIKVQKISLVLVLFIILLVGCAQKKTVNFDPKIGIAGPPDHISLLRSEGYDFIQPSVSGFLMPNKSEEIFLENLQNYENEKNFVYACNIFLPGSLKSTGPDYDPEGILTYAEEVFRRAQKAGAKVIVFGSSGSRSVPKGFSHEEAKQQFISLGKKMGPLAAKYGVVIGVENLNRNESNFINTIAEAYEIVQQIDHPNIKITADIYHMLREEESPKSLREAGKYIYHCDIAEKENRTPPGIAGDDFKPYLQALKDINYKGNIALETRWNDLQTELPVALNELKQQIAELK